MKNFVVCVVRVEVPGEFDNAAQAAYQLGQSGLKLNSIKPKTVKKTVDGVESTEQVHILTGNVKIELEVDETEQVEGNADSTGEKQAA